MELRAEALALVARMLAEVGVKPEELIAAREDAIFAAKELRLLADELEQRALAAWPDEGFDWQVTVEGLGTYVRGLVGNKDTWDHRGAVLAVIKAAMAAERVHHPNDVGDVVLEVAHIDYWRIKELSKLGVDGRQYRERIPGRPTIRLVF